MSDKIDIKDGIKVRCKVCNTTVLIYNNEEHLYCNALIVYFDNKNKLAMAKCKQCKTMIKINP